MSSDGLTFYRCLLCSGVVSVWDIRTHGACRRCNSVRVRPSDLTIWEKLGQVIRHPRVWEWKNETVQTVTSGEKEVRDNVGSDTDPVQGQRSTPEIH